MKKVDAKIVFYFGLLLLIINKFSSSIVLLQELPTRGTGFYLVGMLIVILSIMMERFSWIDIVLILYGIITFYSVGDSTLFTFLVMCLAIKNFELDDVIKAYIKIQTFFLVSCMVLYPILLVLGNSLARVSTLDGRVRYYFLFMHPNTFAIELVFTVIGYLYINRNVVSGLKTYLILLVTAAFIFLFPNSQTGFLIVLIYMLLYFTIRNLKTVWRVLTRMFVPFLLLFVAYIIYIVYSGTVSSVLNVLAGNAIARFINAVQVFQLYDINLFGNKLSAVGQIVFINGEWNRFWFDFGMLRMIFAFGIIGGGLFYFVMTRGAIICIKEKKFDMLLLLFTVLIYSISEWTAFSILTVFPLMFLSEPFRREYRGLKVKQRKIKLSRR